MTQGTEIITKPDGTIDVEKTQNLVWQKTKAALIEGLDVTTNFDGTQNPFKAVLFSQVLDNLHDNMIKMMAGLTSSNIAALTKVILPVSRRVFPNLLAHELIDIEVVKEAFSVAVTKFSARWTFEAVYDAQQSQGLDIEAELMAALSQEMVAEIDIEMITFLIEHALEAKTSYDLNSLDGTLGKKIIATANEILGNRIVISPTVWTFLKAEGSMPDVKTSWMHKYVGVLDDGIKVYVNPYAGDDAPVLICRYERDDAAAKMRVYVPLEASGVIIDPHTFEPVVTFMKRLEIIPADDIQNKIRLVKIEL